MLTKAEENYLKAIFKVSDGDQKPASTNAVSRELSTSAASVTDMIKRLAEKGLVNYEKYHGAVLTTDGRKLATQLVRKHRLWETFLVDTLGFGWDQVHDIAEELEHIDSKELVDRLDAFLGSPKFDPHGDPIPSADGKFTLRQQVPLNKLAVGTEGVVVAVRDHQQEFLQYLDDIGITIDKTIVMTARNEYDRSAKIRVDNSEHTVSNEVCQNIFVKPIRSLDR